MCTVRHIDAKIIRGTLRKTEALGCKTGTQFSSKISAPNYVSDDGANLFTAIPKKVVSIAAKLPNQLIMFYPAVVAA